MGECKYVRAYGLVCVCVMYPTFVALLWKSGGSCVLKCTCMAKAKVILRLGQEWRVKCVKRSGWPRSTVILSSPVIDPSDAKPSVHSTRCQSIKRSRNIRHSFSLTCLEQDTHRRLPHPLPSFCFHFLQPLLSLTHTHTCMFASS